MKTILCYGDSNTWGYIPGTGERLPYPVRWTGLLQAALGEQCRVIEEGLNGRTTVWDDPFKPGRNGLTSLRPVLDSHAPIDCIILMLGTNDLKHYRATHAADAARGAALLIETIQRTPCTRTGDAPVILLISPPEIRGLSPSLQLQFRDAENKSLKFSKHYKQTADDSGSLFLDAAQIVHPSAVDGVHLDPPGHEQLAKHIRALVSQALFAD